MLEGASLPFEGGYFYRAMRALCLVLDVQCAVFGGLMGASSGYYFPLGQRASIGAVIRVPDGVAEHRSAGSHARTHFYLNVVVVVVVVTSVKLFWKAVPLR